MWKRVNTQYPCRICGKPDWCTHNPDDNSACCMRVQSQVSMKNGGWLHLSGSAKPVKRYLPPPIPQSNIDWKTFFIKWRVYTEDNQKSWFASRLGVTVDSLNQLECCFSPEYNAWAFPMRNGENQVVGVRLRSDEGKKWAIKGSKQGLFIPQDVPPQDTAYVCEGPTDTAAVLSLGLYGIGRPFNLGGADDLKTLCRDKGIKRLVYVSDNDEAGQQGIMRVEKTVDLPHVIICPPTKDIREFLNLGGTRSIIETMVRQEVWKV